MPISALNVRESLDSRVVYEIGIKKHDDEVRFKTVSIEIRQIRAGALKNMQYNPNL